MKGSVRRATKHFPLAVAATLLACDGASFAERDLQVTTLLHLLPGTTLPVEVARSIRAGRTPSGTKVVVSTTQRVPVGEHVYLPKGSVVTGVVVGSEAGTKTTGAPPTIALRFDGVSVRGQVIPVITRILAVANFTEVASTFSPASDPSDRGNPSAANWTTRQVGGDEVYRSGWSGDVVNMVTHKVGFADYNGVYGLPDQNTEAGRAKLPRAVGVFSTNALGLYGFDESSQILSADGVGTIRGSGKNLVLKAGDNLLLEVVAFPMR